MPIVVRAVTPKEFDAWVTEAKTKFSDAAPATPDTTTADTTTADATTPGSTNNAPRLLAAAGVQH